jgi:FdhE protein
VTLESWIASHPYLAPLARFREAVDAAVAVERAPLVAPPPLEAFAGEYAQGVPLLASRAAVVDLAPAGALLERLVGRLGGAAVPPKLGEELRELNNLLPRPRSAGERVGERGQEVIAWLAGRGAAPASHAGLLRFLGWAALSRALAPALAAFEAWRDDAAWRRGTCPACGAAPAMAQLALGEDGLAHRRLSCGCCASRWGYARLGCPYCGNDDADLLDVLEIEGEPELRVDGCRACGAYLKTYAGAGREGVLLADWTTLHLDALARDRGLSRRGASLYEL